MAKHINVPQVLEYLHRAFERASDYYGPRSKAVKGTPLYEFQVDFAYLIHEIQTGPPYILPKAIQEANDLIQRMEEKAKGTTEAA